MNMRLSSGLGLLVLWSAQAGAASFTVDSNLDLVDDLPGDGVCDVGPAAPGNPCTLRAAIMEAEANGQADTILIPAGMSINLSLAGSGGTENGDLNIGTDMVIAGFEGAPPGNPALLPLIDASAIADRHFQILGGQVTLRGLRLQGGNSSNSGGSVRIGGGSGTAVRIEHVQLRDNRAAARAGAVLSGGSASLIVEDSLFLRNDGGTAAAGGLAVETNSQVVIRRSTLLDNRASAMPSSTLAVLGNASLRIEDSTVDGSLVRPPIAGLEGAVGIVQFGTSELVLRNVTVSNFAETALDLRDLDGNERTRIGSSVLESDGTACVATGTNLAAADVQIAYSQVRHQSGCLAFYLEGVRNGLADLGPLTDDPPPRLTFSRPPLGPLANVVDRGTPVDDPPADPDLACTDNDQRGGPRPLDADLDGITRCDVGAIETAAPLPFVVNHYADDLTDDLPGDGQCATVPVPGIGPVCTLRAAIMETNALPGLDYIRFAPSAIPVALTLPVTGPVGGALRITEALAIEGNLDNGRPATTISGQMVGQRLLQVQTTDQTVYLRNLALRGGDAVGQVGGAIVLASGELLLDRMELFDNFAGAGGGALAVIGGYAQVERSDFQSNQTDNAGAAIFSNGGSFSVLDSSFRTHLGVRVDGTPIPVIQLLPDTRAFLRNSTFSGNELGLQADQPDQLVLRELTFYDQRSGGLLIDLALGSELYFNNSIIAAPNSAVFDCVISGTGVAGVAEIDALLDSDGSCATLASQGLTGDPLLLPLQRPVGEISYQHAPSAVIGALSPALDRAALTTCMAGRDQYGRPRPVDLPEVANAAGPCDLGAIESPGDALLVDGFE